MSSTTRQKIDKAIELLKEADKDLTDEILKAQVGIDSKQLGIELGCLAASLAALDTV